MRGTVAKRLRRAAKEKWKQIPEARSKRGIEILYEAGKRVYRKAKEGVKHAL